MQEFLNRHSSWNEFKCGSHCLRRARHVNSESRHTVAYQVGLLSLLHAAPAGCQALAVQSLDGHVTNSPIPARIPVKLAPHLGHISGYSKSDFALFQSVAPSKYYDTVSYPTPTNIPFTVTIQFTWIYDRCLNKNLFDHCSRQLNT